METCHWQQLHRFFVPQNFFFPSSFCGTRQGFASNSTVNCCANRFAICFTQESGFLSNSLVAVFSRAASDVIRVCDVILTPAAHGTLGDALPVQMYRNHQVTQTHTLTHTCTHTGKHTSTLQYTCTQHTCRQTTAHIHTLSRSLSLSLLEQRCQHICEAN